MNNVIERKWCTKGTVYIEDLTGTAFTGEDGGHTFVISGVNPDGTSVTLSGTVAGAYILPDGSTQPLTGSIADGKAQITLDPECYALPGRGQLTIFLTSNGQKVAIYGAVLNVARSSTDQVPPAITADVADLVNDIEEARASIPASYTNLMASLAKNYADLTYPISTGTYAWQDGWMYRAKVDIPSAESWTASHWEKVPLTDSLVGELSSLKSALNSVRKLDTVVGKANNLIKRAYLIDGEYIYTDGTVRKSANFCRTDYIEVEASQKYIGVGTGLSAFYDENLNFISPTVSNFNNAVTAPATAKYLRLSIPVASKNTCGLSKGQTILASYDDGFLNINTVTEPIIESVQKISNESGLIQSYNWKTGFININHEIIVAAGRKYSDYIVCPPNSSVTYIAENNHNNVYGISFYDVHFGFLSGYANNGTLGEPVTVTSPSETAYCRLSITDGIADNAYVSLEQNGAQTILNTVSENKFATDILYEKKVRTGTLVSEKITDVGYIESVSPIPTKLIVNGVNQWDEQWELGTYGLSTGNPNPGTATIRSKTDDPIPVIPNAEYYWCFPYAINTAILFYKADGSYQGTYVLVQPGAVITIPNDAYYIKFYCVSQYGTTYNSDIQLAFNSDSQKNIYHAYNGSVYQTAKNIILNDGMNYIFAVGETLSITVAVMAHKNDKQSETYKKEYESGYIHFTVPVNQYIVDNSLTTNAAIDNENTIVDVDCILSLPTSYTRDGLPTKLIMMCHGAGRGVYGNDTAFDDQGDWRQIAGYNRLVNAFLANGYAVFDCNGYANTRNGCTFWGAQRGIEAWRKAYDYVVKNYNVEDNVSIYGFSMGGCTALNLVMRNFPNVKCIAVGSPVTNLDQTTYEHAGEDAFNEAWGINAYNSAILRGNDPMQTVVTIDNVDYCFKTLPPLKIWFGSIETWPAPSDAQRLVNAIKNAGGKADLRICEGRGHGLSYGEVPYVVDEIIMYFNRFNY